MSVKVAMPDGKIAEFPDGTDPATMEKALQDLHSADAQLNSEDRWHKVKLAMQAPVKGAASLGAVIGDALLAPLHFAMPSNIEMPEQVKGMPLSRALSEAGEQPKTRGERYMQSALEGAGGGVVGSAAKVARNATIGAISGTTGEAAGDVTNNNPVARIVGALVGGGAGAGALRTGERISSVVRPNVKEVARQTMGNIPDDDLALAVARMRGWKGEGFKGTAAQAVDTPSPLDKLQDVLASHPAGKETQTALRGQPEDVMMGGTQAVARLGGKVQSVPAVANAVQDTATKAIEEARGEAGKAWRQLAGNEVEEVPPEAIAALDKQLAALAARYPNQSAADMINDARKALRAPSQAKGPAQPQILGPRGEVLNPPAEGPKYLTNALQLKEALEDRMSTFGSRELNTPGADAKMLRRAMEVRGAFGEVLDQFAPKLRAADDAYNVIMRDSVDPLKQSAIGQLAGRKGYQEDVQAPVAKLNALLDRGTVNPKASDILHVAGVLNKHDPEVWPTVVSTWVGDKLAHLKVRESESQFSPETAKMIRDTLWGSPAKAQGLRDMLAGVADAQGKPREEIVRGFERYMDIVDAAAKRPGEVSGMSAGDIERVAGHSGKAEVLRMASYFAPSHAASELSKWTSNRVLADVDKLFTTPEGLQTLSTLAKTPPASKLAFDTLTTFRAATAVADSEEQ